MRSFTIGGRPAAVCVAPSRILTSLKNLNVPRSERRQGSSPDEGRSSREKCNKTYAMTVFAAWLDRGGSLGSEDVRAA